MTDTNERTWYRCDAEVQRNVRCMEVASWRVELLAQPDKANHACDPHIAEFLDFEQINTVRYIGE